MAKRYFLGPPVIIVNTIEDNTNRGNSTITGYLHEHIPEGIKLTKYLYTAPIRRFLDNLQQSSIAVHDLEY